MLISPDAQMFLSLTKAALALPILAVTSRSVPPSWKCRKVGVGGGWWEWWMVVVGELVGVTSTKVKW